ncbi:hypothetical protein J437_LFUL013311 [Ladona fulva]|uniref:Phospholipase A2 n=1 Tax=Ladona fulva TaxID=123851 RepID=A0A8K0KE80_LADFU|nr:hypothetical protein J437_LFUL013311 [Ladona fulva]
MAVYISERPVFSFLVETKSQRLDTDLDNDIGANLDSDIELRTIDSHPDYDESDVGRMQIIFPGTKWCGTGNVSGHDEDYGIFEEEDKCCKEHDYCPETMNGGESKYGLNNDAFYTRLDCSCDYKFYNCLKTVDTHISHEIGFTYFNTIGTKCYRNDYPIVRCHHYSSFIKQRCRVYELDRSKPKMWQWFDLPIY